MKKILVVKIIYCLLSVSSFAQIGEQKILPSDGGVKDNFGMSVSISGDYAMVGSPFNNDSVGAVYVFRRDGTVWLETQKLIASDGVKGDMFGGMIGSISISGNYAIIGAPNAYISKGTAYIFKREGINWIEKQKLQPADLKDSSWFGTSVSISDSFAVIGTTQNWYSGSAYIFRKEEDSWIEKQKLISSDSVGGSWFGASVSIYKDNIIIGAPGENFIRGSAYIFKREANAWIEEQKITASDGAPLNYFGFAVSMFGDYAVIGAIGARRAYLFKKENTYWIEKQKLTPSDGSYGKDYFGASVSIWQDYVVIGVPGDDSSSGSAYIFNSDGISWIERSKLIATDRIKNDIFGVSVSIAENDLIVGVAGDDDNGENSGSAYIYTNFVVGVENDESEIPLSFSLDQNYPNPFNPSTTIRYSIPQYSNVVIKVYDVLGNEIETLVSEDKSVGTYEITWYAQNLPSGIYFYQLKSESFVETKKMLLLK